MNEAGTRAEHIDPALAAAGWGVVEGSRIRREVPITLGRLEGAGEGVYCRPAPWCSGARGIERRRSWESRRCRDGGILSAMLPAFNKCASQCAPKANAK